MAVFALGDFWPFQHLEMAMPVTEPLSYEYGATKTTQHDAQYDS